jgi:hypothetical protein
MAKIAKKYAEARNKIDRKKPLVFYLKLPMQSLMKP